jgi:hypothetical protein
MGDAAAAAQGAAKRPRLSVEPGPRRAQVESIQPDGAPDLVPAVSREQRFDAWLAKQPVPWSAEAAQEQAAAATAAAAADDASATPAAAAAAAAAADPKGDAGGGEDDEEPADKFKEHREAQVHLMAAYEEMNKLKWALELFDEKKMAIARLDNKQDAQLPTEEELLAESEQRVSAKQQHLRGAASRLRERAATLRASVEEGRAYHRELAKLNRAWRVTRAAAAPKGVLSKRDVGPGHRHVVDCFMPNGVGAGHGGESYVGLRKREDGTAAVLSPASCCRVTVADAETYSVGQTEEEEQPAAAAAVKHNSDAGAAACHQLLRRAQRGQQNQLLARLLVDEAKELAVAGGPSALSSTHQVHVVVDPSMLHLEYLPGRALRFGLHLDPMPKQPPAAAQASQDTTVSGAEGVSAMQRHGGTDTSLALLMRGLVLSTAGAAVAASAKPEILAQLVAAARLRASRDTAFDLLDALLRERRQQQQQQQQQRAPVVHWLPSSGSDTVIELSMPTRGRLRLVLPVSGSGMVRVSSFGAARPRSEEMRMNQLGEFLRVELGLRPGGIA